MSAPANPPFRDCTSEEDGAATVQNPDRGAFRALLTVGVIITVIGVVFVIVSDRLTAAVFVTVVGLAMIGGAAWRLPPRERVTERMRQRFHEVLQQIPSPKIQNRLNALLAIAVADLDRVQLESYRNSMGDQQQREPLY
jgi:hypothetical protein